MFANHRITDYYEPLIDGFVYLSLMPSFHSIKDKLLPFDVDLPVHVAKSISVFVHFEEIIIIMGKHFKCIIIT